MSVRAVMFDLGHTLWGIEAPPGRADRLYEDVRSRLAQSSRDAVPDAARLRQAIARQFHQEDIDYLAKGKLEQLPSERLVGNGLDSLGLAAGPDLLSEITAMIVDPNVFTLLVDEKTKPTLFALRGRGLRLGVVSNTWTPGSVICEQLAKHALLPYLDSVISSADMALRKPHPAIFQRALAEVAVRPEEAVFVGDSLIADVHGAQAVGMRGVLCRQYRQEDPRGPSPDAQVQGLKAWVEGSPPDHIIERLEEIVDYVDRLNFGTERD
jgi:FMN phosphatase YigB (HAD superfamily)